MSKLFGSMTDAEINETAQNLRETGETDAIRAMAAENDVEDESVKAFLDGKTDSLIQTKAPDDNKASESQPEDTPGEPEGQTAEKAVDKLRRESTGTGNKDRAQERITEYLTELCEKDGKFGKLVEQPHKTLTKCLGYIRDEARKRITGNWGCLDDDEVYGFAADYYRLDDAEIERKKAEAEKARKADAAKAAARKKEKAEESAKKPPAKKSPDETAQLSLF